MVGERGEVMLKVAELAQREFGQWRVRIDPKVMEELGLGEGDVVEIIGERKTTARVYPGYSSDRDTGIIRMDVFTRKSVGVEIGDKVTVRKVEVKDALTVKLMPEVALSIDENFISLVKKKLLDKPLCWGGFSKYRF